MQKSLHLITGTLICMLIGLFACGCNRSTKQEERVARKLLESVLSFCREDDGTVRPAEAISAMAAVVGERCIDAAGEYKVRGHTFVPGQRVFSDKVNLLLSGDRPDTQLDAIPANSVFGIIRDRLAGSAYPHHFPDIAEVYSAFAANIGKPEDWGKVPLLLPEENRPLRLPLRLAFDSRSAVDETLKTISGDKQKCLRVSATALAILLRDLQNQIDPTIALNLAFGTVNGMAKTAPMKEEPIDSPTSDMREAQHNVVKIEHRQRAQ